MKFSLGQWLIAKLTKWLTKNGPPTHAYLCDFDRISYEVKPGDVLLIEGRNRISHIIQKVTQSPWSHAALYIGRLTEIEDPTLRLMIKNQYHGPESTQLLIESMLGKGTIVLPLTHYQPDHIRISRPQGLSLNDTKKVISFAINRLGGAYSLRHVFDLFRFLLPWGLLPRRWRSTLFEYNPHKPTEDICSSMLAEAFNSVDFPILPLIKVEKDKGIVFIKRNPRIYTPSDFDYSPYFAIIKYPIFPGGEHAPYHELPWSKEVVPSLTINDKKHSSK